MIEAPVQPGQVLASKYQVEKVLGAGGFGVVVAARHMQLGQRVALKFLLPNAMSNAEMVQRFLREAQACVRLKGEHVARVSDVGSLDTGAPYMVMELLDGQDLSHVLSARGRLPLEEVVDYMIQACDALAEAHSLGIVHRDIKPANFFLTQSHDGSPMVKLLDFGISKMDGQSQGAMTSTTAVLGSPFYMSPEQMRSSKSADARSDVWSMGVVLHELLTGAVPFPAESLPELCTMVLMNDPPPLAQFRPDLPAEVGQIVARCMAKEPAHRFQSIAELANALSAFAPERSRYLVDRILRTQGMQPAVRVSQVPVQPSMPGAGAVTAGAGWGQASAAPPTKNKTPLMIAGLALLLVGGGIGAFALTRTPKPAGPATADTATAQPTAAAAPADTASAAPSATVSPAVASAAPQASATVRPKVETKAPTAAAEPKPAAAEPKPAAKPKVADDGFGTARH